MNFKILATEPFQRKAKKLAAKYPSFKNDIAEVFKELEVNPTSGTPLGKDCFKIRVAIASKGKGKSGGARLITYVRVFKSTVYLLTIYDKGEQENISDKELQKMINQFAE